MSGSLCLGTLVPGFGPWVLVLVPGLGTGYWYRVLVPGSQYGVLVLGLGLGLGPGSWGRSEAAERTGLQGRGAGRDSIKLTTGDQNAEAAYSATPDQRLQ